jgi:hypothetical protein
MNQIIFLVLSLCICIPINAQNFSLLDEEASSPQSVQISPSVPIHTAQTVKLIIDDDLPVELPQILGSGNYEIGDLVELSIAPYDSPDNLYSVVYNWTVLPETPVTEWPDGSRIFFGTGKTPRTLEIVMTASYVFVERDDNNVILDIAQGALTVRTQVKIGGGGGGGNGGGGNGGGGNGDEPTFDSKLAQNSYNWLKKININENYTDAEFQNNIIAVRDSFLQIQKRILNNEFTGPQAIVEIFEITKKSNDIAMGDNDEYWRPWFDEMTLYFRQQFENGSITTPEQYGEAWRQIAEGLSEAVK